MFPRFDEIVSGVPEYDGYATLACLEASTDQFAAAHRGVAVRDRYRPARPRPASSRLVLA